MNLPQLTTTEWVGVAALFAIFALVLLWLRRLGDKPPFRELKLHGPAVPPEFDKVFGAYTGSPVKGLIVLNDGIRVGYEDGSHLRFMPVPSDAVVYYGEDGQLHVAPLAGK